MKRDVIILQLKLRMYRCSPSEDQNVKPTFIFMMLPSVDTPYVAVNVRVNRKSSIQEHANAHYPLEWNNRC
ncbi:MAG: hypothetical protein C0490_17330 [Marivirga sp.]|nr:hypothetical protein [Marivirga sp.]